MASDLVDFDDCNPHPSRVVTRGPHPTALPSLPPPLSSTPSPLPPPFLYHRRCSSRRPNPHLLLAPRSHRRSQPPSSALCGWGTLGRLSPRHSPSSDSGSSAAATAPSSTLCGRGHSGSGSSIAVIGDPNPLPPPSAVWGCSADSLPTAPLPLIPTQAQSPPPPLPLPSVVGGASVPALAAAALELEPKHPLPQRAEEGRR